MAGNDKAPKAICLSGGGIRSATFSLGVLQGLARDSDPENSEPDQLAQFDYISSVSGGGYIASWLSRWRTGELADPEANVRVPAGTIGEALFETPDTMEAPNHPIRRLRSFSNYLAPRLGLSLDTITLAIIFLRNLLFNLLFWIPLFLAVAVVPRLIVRLVPRDAQLPRLKGQLEVAALGPTFVIVAGCLAGMLLVLLLSRFMLEQRREFLSRCAAIFVRVAIAYVLLFGLFVYLPMIVLSYAWEHFYTTLAAGGTLPIITALMGYWSRYGPDLRKKAYGVATKLGVRLLDICAVLAILAMCAAASFGVHAILGGAHDISGWEPDNFRAFMLTGPPPPRIVQLLLLLGGLAVAASYFVGANRFSLHALYGNRLVRAYLGSTRRERPRRSSFTDFDPEDNVAMSDMPGGWNWNAGQADRPFHVVNMTVNLAKPLGYRLDWQERKGASFIATPLHCGANVERIGYIDNRQYGGRWGMTLGRAMTISGAAASPNMGYHSSFPVALVMSVFNVRLGWWAPNPSRWQFLRPAGGVVIPRDGSEPLFGLRYVLKEAFSGTSSSSRWLYLSDGGHFDNLGLYEMVRRRCRRIVVIDAGCDGEFQHSDLHMAVRRIQVDLAVPIDLPSVLPGQKGKAARRRILIGSIRYSELGDGYPDGQLIVVKPILTGDEPPALTYYAEISRSRGNTFPHHSTADQFFTETQFESYRRLGEFSAKELKRAMAAFPDLEETQPALFPLIDGADDRDRDAKPDPTPAPATLSGVDGLKASVDTMGPGRMAAALVAGLAGIGVASGAGTSITEKFIKNVSGVGDPPAIELRLNKKDRALLEKRFEIRASADATITIRRLSATLRVLAGGLAKCGCSGAGRQDFTPLIVQIQRMTASLNLYLQRQRPPYDVRFDQDNLLRILAVLEGPQGALATRHAQVRADLDAIARKLDLIARRVEATGPRRNIRGSE